MPSPILLDLPDSLTTERLLLRSPRTGDGPVLHEALVESLPELRRFLASLPWVAHEQTIESAETYCRTARSRFLAREDMPYPIFERATDRLVGATGLHRPVWETPKVEVGYWGRTSTAGNGFITEAVNSLVAFAFKTLGMVRIELITDDENAASRKVASRCHFELEGIHRSERRAPDGSLRNTCVYARLR